MKDSQPVMKDSQTVTGQEAEGELIADLLSNYEVNARPVLEPMTAVLVNLSIALHQLIDLVSTVSGHLFNNYDYWSTV